MKIGQLRLSAEKSLVSKSKENTCFCRYKNIDTIRESFVNFMLKNSQSFHLKKHPSSTRTVKSWLILKILISTVNLFKTKFLVIYLVLLLTIRIQVMELLQALILSYLELRFEHFMAFLELGRHFSICLTKWIILMIRN